MPPIPGPRSRRPGPASAIDPPAGRAFLRGEVVEAPLARGGARTHLPLLDGSDTVGAMVLTLDGVGEEDRRLLRRLADPAADRCRPHP